MASNKRSQEELGLVFEQYKVDFDRIYRMSLRKDPTLKGAVTLKLKIQPNGTVSACSVLRSELNDEGLHRRLSMKCTQMKFESRGNVEVAEVEFPIRFMP